MLKMKRLANHLGNVLAVVAGDSTWAGTVSVADYYPFGLPMEGRSWNNSTYRYGFNGKEKVDDIAGSGNHYTAPFWEYSPRIGRRWNVDPIVKSHESPDVTFANNPIWIIDPNGADSMLVNKKSGKILGIKEGGEDFVFMTNKKKESEKAWKKSDQLFHSLNISGAKGGSPSNKKDPVIWSELNDVTDQFNKLLNDGISIMEIHKDNFEKAEFRIPGNKQIEKNRFFNRSVTDGAPYDIKAHIFHVGKIGEWSFYDGKLRRYDDYGNILYGASGKAFGLSNAWLIMGAHLNQLGKTGLDEDRDTYTVKMGFKAYENWNKSTLKIIKSKE